MQDSQGSWKEGDVSVHNPRLDGATLQNSCGKAWVDHLPELTCTEEEESSSHKAKVVSKGDLVRGEAYLDLPHALSSPGIIWEEYRSESDSKGTVAPQPMTVKNNALLNIKAKIAAESEGVKKQALPSPKARVVPESTIVRQLSYLDCPYAISSSGIIWEEYGS